MSSAVILLQRRYISFCSPFLLVEITTAEVALFVLYSDACWMEIESGYSYKHICYFLVNITDVYKRL